jgi:hypothetical protein
MFKPRFSLAVLSAFLAVAGAQAQNPPDLQRKIAIIVENRADASLNDKVAVLEDLVTSRIAGKGFSVVSRSVVLDALKTYPAASVNVSTQSSAKAGASAAAGQTATATDAAKVDAAQSSAVDLQAKAGSGASDKLSVEGTRKDAADINAARQHSEKAYGQGSANLDAATSDTVRVAATAAAAKLDQALSDSTSALRLAQNLGVDYILIPSITGYGAEKKSYSGNGVQTLNVIHRLRVSYKIVEANAGGAVRGGSFVAESTQRDTPSLQTDSTDTLNALLEDAASQLADAIFAGAKTLPAEVAKAGMVSFKVACTMADPRQQPILISAVSVSADNKLVATNPPAAVQAMDVTVELDGVAIGSAPGEFKAHPGLHKLRLAREGFADWERTVNIYDGQTLRVALQMSDAGYARWKDATAFLSVLEAGRKLTDAEVKQIEGWAKFLSESHYRVDTKENIHLNKSLY